MQDIGCRSYTYISTLAKCMEAAGEKGIELVVLDRPNPLGGIRVEGPAIESRWISFIGQLPVPYVHGMTAGELARMANALGWTQPPCRLTVIPMRGWSRQMVWEDTGPALGEALAQYPVRHLAPLLRGHGDDRRAGRDGNRRRHAPGLPDRRCERGERRAGPGRGGARCTPQGVTFTPYVRRAGSRGCACTSSPTATRISPRLGVYLLAGMEAGNAPGSLRAVRRREAGDVLQGLRQRRHPRPGRSRDGAGADRRGLGGSRVAVRIGQRAFLLY